MTMIIKKVTCIGAVNQRNAQNYVQARQGAFVKDKKGVSLGVLRGHGSRQRSPCTLIQSMGNSQSVQAGLLMPRLLFERATWTRFSKAVSFLYSNPINGQSHDFYSAWPFV